MVFSGAVIASAAGGAELFSSAEAAKIIGFPVIHTRTIGPEKDDDAPAQATHWVHQAKEAVVVVTRLDFTSAADAKIFATPEFVKKENDSEEGKVTVDAGVGEKTFWTVTPDGSALTFLQGSHIASIAFSGRNIGSPESHKEALKAAALVIAGRL